MLLERDGGANKPYREVPCGLDSPRLGSYLADLPPTPNSPGGWQVVDKGAESSDLANHYVMLGVLPFLCTPSIQNRTQKLFLNYGILAHAVDAQVM